MNAAVPAEGRDRPTSEIPKPQQASETQTVHAA